MSEKPMSKLDQTRTEIETLLRQFQAWGLAILQERKAELERSIAESGGQIPAVEVAVAERPTDTTEV
ncbi:MAG: hypothetical protein GWP61_18815 [Chloroflexi bacterium]|jgi:hypothetical protein|nr:hypothetical protein [Chloroflexota bacterium]